MLGQELTPAGETWPISDRMTLRLFWAEIFAGTPRYESDHDELRWLSAEDLESLNWLDADRAALAEIQAELTS